MSIQPQLHQTHAAKSQIASLSDFSRRALLLDLAKEIENQVLEILVENKKDLDLLPDSDPKKDRLLLTEPRILDIGLSIRHVAQLDDPTGIILREYYHSNGLNIKKIAVPIGVVGVIYESRPNVTLDVAALCLRSGNACVLRGGSDAWNSNRFLVELIQKVLVNNKLSPDLVVLISPDRELLPEFLTSTRFIDVMIPRGSDQLIQYVRQHSRIPTIETGAGVVHTYIHTSADLVKAAQIVVNAKTSRPSVCNALDCVLVDQSIAPDFLPLLIPGFERFVVEVHADPLSYEFFSSNGYKLVLPAEPSDFGKEWLDFKVSIKCVSCLDEALEHIDLYSSKHSEAIIAEDKAIAARFMAEVDAAAVYVNASTRFTDGGEFGLGAEIGISTQKLHARGPFALEKLTTEKWLIAGVGQIRD